MASILKPFSSILNPGTFQVPSGPGQYTIDWNSSLANGLIACWLPGLSLVDIASGLTLTTFSSGSPGSMNQEGAAATAPSANTGAFSNTGLASQFTSWTGFTVRWRGYYDASGQNQAPFLSITYDSSGTLIPFLIAGMRLSAGAIQATWNTAATFTTLASGASLNTNTIEDIVVTFVVGGNTTIYFNGVSNASAAFGAGGPTSTATATIELNNDIGAAATRFQGTDSCNIAQMWNRALSAGEVAALYLAPYSLIVPAEYELPAMFVPPPPVFILMPQIVM